MNPTPADAPLYAWPAIAFAALFALASMTAGDRLALTVGRPRLADLKGGVGRAGTKKPAKKRGKHVPAGKRK